VLYCLGGSPPLRTDLLQQSRRLAQQAVEASIEAARIIEVATDSRIASRYVSSLSQRLHAGHLPPTRRPAPAEPFQSKLDHT
jgi:hypothetical protein